MWGGNFWLDWRVQITCGEILRTLTVQKAAPHTDLPYQVGGPCDKFSDYLSVPLPQARLPQEIHNTKVVEVDLANFSCQIPVINITTSPRFLDNYIRDGSLLRKESGHPRTWPLPRRLDGAIANVRLSSTPSAGTSARRVPLPSTPTFASTSQYSEAAGRERERWETNDLGSVGDIVDIKVNGAVQKG